MRLRPPTIAQIGVFVSLALSSCQHVLDNASNNLDAQGKKFGSYSFQRNDDPLICDKRKNFALAKLGCGCFCLPALHNFLKPNK